MTEQDKLMAFGSWLTTRSQTLQAELFATATNGKQPDAAVRVKAGHVEAMAHVLASFRSLYQNDLAKWTEEYLGVTPKQEEEESDNGSD